VAVLAHIVIVIVIIIVIVVCRLQRIYGTAWETSEQLAAYQHLKAEAARRDHRKLGQELDLFSIQDGAGGNAR
jgi:threonyl-tRNA synthetase